MRILLGSSEIHPYSKSGGLADMVGALAKAMANAGHHVDVVTPLYRGIKERFADLHEMDWQLDLPMGDHWVSGKVQTRQVGDNLRFLFVDQPGFYQRGSLYTEKGVDYPDNADRFIFFSKAIVNLARYLPDPPDVVHVHDWQAGLVPLYILHQRLHEGWGTPPRTVLTIHNLAYQGLFPKSAYQLTNLPTDYYHPAGLEFFGAMNCLKAGISYSDILTTVSPRYAREITTEEYGCGLDGVLRRRQNVLFGILNGVDYDEWKTQGNPFLPAAYSPRNLAGKAVNKRELQKELGLPEAPDVPLFGNITRLADQKGVDIQLGALEEMIAAPMQFVLLGSGSPEFERAYKKLAERYSEKVSVRIGFDHGLSHRIEAGTDFYLMPSRFEPCGLNQMYSLRYGTVPIVRITGGLDDSVIDFTEDPEEANGIKFKEYSVRALSKAIRKGLIVYENQELLKHYRINGMARDFSWERTAGEYEKLYEA